MPAEHTLKITEEERAELITVLEHTITAMQVEEHRTDSPRYREKVIAEESVLESVVGKRLTYRTAGNRTE